MTDMENTTTSIYQRLLGADFERLGPILRRVHGPEPRICAAGSVTVTHGPGRIVGLLNWLMRVPPAALDVPLTLTIARSADREKWVRDFGGKPLVTDQWAQDGLFIEAVGSIHMAMRLEMRGDRLCFDPVRTTCFGITIPRWLRVNVRAEVEEQPTNWRIFVETNSGLLGLLFRYEGTIALHT